MSSDHLIYNSNVLREQYLHNSSSRFRYFDVSSLYTRFRRTHVRRARTIVCFRQRYFQIFAILRETAVGKFWIHRERNLSKSNLDARVKIRQFSPSQEDEKARLSFFARVHTTRDRVHYRYLAFFFTAKLDKYTRRYTLDGHHGLTRAPLQKMYERF